MKYYKAHKNKKPRRVFRRKRKYVSMMIPLLAITSAVSASQIAVINSQPILHRPTKRVDIATQVVNSASAMVNIIKGEKQRRFKATGRYER